MIELNVEPYCENCPMFDVEMKQGIFKSYDFKQDEQSYVHSVVVCSHKEVCHEIYLYLKSQLDSMI